MSYFIHGPTLISFTYRISGPSMVQVAAIAQLARYSACEIVRHRWEHQAVSVYRVAAIVLVFVGGT